MFISAKVLIDGCVQYPMLPFLYLLDSILNAETTPKKASEIICLLECTMKFTGSFPWDQLNTSFYGLENFTYEDDLEFYKGFSFDSIISYIIYILVAFNA